MFPHLFLQTIGETIYTVEEVFSELRCARSRGIADTLPFEIRVLQPDDESIERGTHSPLLSLLLADWQTDCAGCSCAFLSTDWRQCSSLAYRLAIDRALLPSAYSAFARRSSPSRTTAVLVDRTRPSAPTRVLAQR